MSVTTKTGDGGTTGLPGGARVPKDDPRIECLGTLDELDAFLAAAQLKAENPAAPASGTANIIGEVRTELVSVMAAVAGTESGVPGPARLENFIAELEADTPLSPGFLRNWTQPAPVHLNIARTVCRRAERRAVTLAGTSGSSGAAVYLNRLSDLLFLLAAREHIQSPP
jgi:cob(I)alamin adenosyltransferase